MIEYWFHLCEKLIIESLSTLDQLDLAQATDSHIFSSAVKWVKLTKINSVFVVYWSTACLELHGLQKVTLEIRMNDYWHKHLVWIDEWYLDNNIDDNNICKAFWIRNLKLGGIIIILPEV